MMNVLGGRLSAIVALLCGLIAVPAVAQETGCASVKIQIKQQLTLERQAFDAEMKINNTTDSGVISNVSVVVKVMEENGTPVAVTEDPNASGAKFFIRASNKQNISDLGASASSGRSEGFTLDANSNRLTHSKTGSGTWVYDNAGQLTQRPAAGGTGTVGYQYDVSGNLTQKTDTSKAEPARTTRYTWDALKCLSEVLDGAGDLIARYRYDPFDRRIRKELGNSATLIAAGPGASDIRNTITHYLQSEWGTLAEADSAGKVQTAYGWYPQNQAGTAPMPMPVHRPTALSTPRASSCRWSWRAFAGPGSAI